MTDMTLREWCAELPPTHLVNRELADMDKERIKLQAIVDAALALDHRGPINSIVMTVTHESLLSLEEALDKLKQGV